MGAISLPQPVLLLLAAFSRHEKALVWARERTANIFGAIALASEPFKFAETDYYRSTMGEGLQKIFFAYEQLIDPSKLPSLKHQTNGWEEEYAALGGHQEARPLNLDPGYLTEAKLVLASSKDHHHRLYLARGVYAECTLYFQQGQWKTREWTYPDYQRPDYHAFFTHCRNYLRERRRSSG